MSLFLCTSSLHQNLRINSQNHLYYRCSTKVSSLLQSIMSMSGDRNQLNLFQCLCFWPWTTSLAEIKDMEVIYWSSGGPVFITEEDGRNSMTVDWNFQRRSWLSISQSWFANNLFSVPMCDYGCFKCSSLLSASLHLFLLPLLFDSLAFGPKYIHWSLHEIPYCTTLCPHVRACLRVLKLSPKCI